VPVAHACNPSFSGEIRRIAVQSQPGQIVHNTLSQKTLHKKGLVEWLKVKVLKSSPSNAINKQTNKQINK
jgi:hypothetical protein